MINWEPLINSVKKMIQLEHAHLSMLSNRGAPQECIDKSKEMLDHYKKRLKEYENFSNKQL